MTTTLSSIAAAMREHDREHAAGSETAQWGAFVEECHKNWGIMPWDDAAEDTVVSEGFAAYWTAVARRDYDAAALVGDVDPDWIEEDRS